MRYEMGKLLRLLVVLALLAGGCTGRAEEPLAEDTPQPSVSEAEEPSASPSPSRSPRPSPSPRRPLEDRYYQDADGNLIPDFVEVELGLDPAVDDCLQQTCPGADAILTTGDPEALQENVLLILDSSGSMAGADASGALKIDAARQALERYVVGTPDTTQLGLLVYGHRGNNQESGKAESCAGIDVFAPLGQLTPESTPGVLAQFAPTGYTPIAASLQRAAAEFAGREGQSNRVILVTDGIETCDGDPVAAASALKQSGIAVTVDVVGFNVPDSAEQAALRAIAETTGGTYTNADTAESLNTWVDSLLQQENDAYLALRCLENAWLTSGVCRVNTSSDAASIVQRERDAAGVGSARYQALEELRLAIGLWPVDRNQEAAQIIVPQLQALVAAWEEARARYEERYGRTIGATFHCPADGFDPWRPAVA